MPSIARSSIVVAPSEKDRSSSFMPRPRPGWGHGVVFNAFLPSAEFGVRARTMLYHHHRREPKGGGLRSTPISHLQWGGSSGAGGSGGQSATLNPCAESAPCKVVRAGCVDRGCPPPYRIDERRHGRTGGPVRSVPVPHSDHSCLVRPRDNLRPSRAGRCRSATFARQPPPIKACVWTSRPPIVQIVKLNDCLGARGVQ